MNLPNYITLFRILLVPIIFSFIVYYNPAHSHFRPVALILFLIAVSTDALDGFIARTFKKRTELGTFLDPFADKLLLLSAFFAIAFSSAFVLKPPMWIVIIIVFRDLFIVCGLIIILLTTSQIRIQPNLVGKLTTFFQMLTVLVVLAEWPHSHFIWLTTAFLTLLSAVLYLLQGIKLLNSPSP